jgi:hypothetical protein
MFDLGAYDRLPAIALLLGLVKRVVPVCRLIGEVLGLGRNLFESRTLLLAPIGAVPIEPSLAAVQQSWLSCTLAAVTLALCTKPL